MLGETEIKKIVGVFVTFLSLLAFQLGARAPWTPLATLKGGNELLLKNGTIDGYAY